VEHGKKLKVHLEIFINEEAAKGVDLDNLVGLFKGLKEQKHEGKKATVTINQLP
jgi:retrograde regulation protein 2